MAGPETRLAERFGNARVVPQELEREHGLTVSLRMIERAAAPLRPALRAEARATMRFETQTGRHLQIDFGDRQVRIGGEAVRVYLFVAALASSDPAP